MKKSDTTAPWYMKRDGALQYCSSHILSDEYIVWPVIKDLCGKVDGKKILDLGTAAGDIAQKLAAIGANCLGVDVSSEMLQIAHEATQKEGLEVEYLERDCSNLEGIPDNEFDITIMNFLLCNVSLLSKIDSVFQEAYRVTKPNGNVIFTIHHPLQLTLKADTLASRSVVANDGPSYYFSSGEKVKRFLRTHSGVAIVDNFHWTIDDYISSLVKAGFLVDAIKEPKPTSPPLEFAENFEQAYLTPLYLVVRGIKK